MCTAIRTPTWVSKRRMFEQTLSDLHNCSNINYVKQIQAQIFKENLHQDPFVAPKLIQVYSRCRQMNLAVNLFNQIQEPNIHLYNALMKAFVSNSQHAQAFSTFFELQKNGLFPDNFTYPILLKACSGQFVLRQVQMIHTHTEKFGFYSDIFVPNSLIDTYSRCGKTGIYSAKKLFDSMTDRDVVSWNSIIGGLVKLGELSEARKLFDEMPERDSVSWNTILDGHVKAGEVNAAFELFQQMPERNVVSWSTMVSGYSKAGDMDMAQLLFDKMPVKSLVPWTIMISGYAEKGLAKEALALYNQMEKAGLKPDDGTLISIFAACAKSGLFSLGQIIHNKIEKSKLRYSVSVSNALLDMYAKCGNLDMASTVFNGMVERNVVSWNTMLQGLAFHGCGKRALDLFSRMIQEGVTPDGLTFISLLSCCSHAGLVDEAQHYFSVMEKEFGIVLQVEHYGCMVDILGRGGHLKEAFELIKSMPMKPNAIIWGTLMGACRVHNDVELAEYTINQLVKFDTGDAGTLAIMSNIHAAARDWKNVAKVRLQMKNTGTRKTPGISSIEVDDKVHEFAVADTLHPESARIYHMIDRLGEHLRKAGYVPRAQY